MTTRAKVCQYVILAYLGYALIDGLMLAFRAFQAEQLRVLGIGGLLVVIRSWFILQVTRRSEAWVWIMGFFAALAVLLRPLWLFIPFPLAASGRLVSWTQPGFWAAEVALAVFAVCCFLIESEWKGSRTSR